MLTLAGCWVRQIVSISESNYYFLVVGSCIAAMGQPFLINPTSKVSSAWFGDKEVNCIFSQIQRAFATSFGSMSMPLGCLISFVLPSLIIGDKDKGDMGQQHVTLYLIISNVIMTFCCVPCVIFMKEKPPSPPSCANEGVP